MSVTCVNMQDNQRLKNICHRYELNSNISKHGRIDLVPPYCLEWSIWVETVKNYNSFSLENKGVSQYICKGSSGIGKNGKNCVSVDYW